MYFSSSSSHFAIIFKVEIENWKSTKAFRLDMQLSFIKKR